MIQDRPSGIYFLASLLHCRPIRLFVHSETRDARTLMQAAGLPLFFILHHIAACEGVSGISSKILLPVKLSGALQGCLASPLSRSRTLLQSICAGSREKFDFLSALQQP